MPINLARSTSSSGPPWGPAEAKALIQEQAGELAGTDPQNLNDKGIQLIGRPLYEAFIKYYTGKQWQTDPEGPARGHHLPPPGALHLRQPVLQRQVRGPAVNGYTAWIERMADHPNIEVHLKTDFFDDAHEFSRATTLGQIPVVYTGPVDRYFDYAEGDLSWRTIDLEEEVLDVGDFQGTSVMNYTDEDVPYTRIHRVPPLPPGA